MYIIRLMFLVVPHSALLQSKGLKYGPCPTYTTHIWPSSSPASLTHLTIIWTIASTHRQSESCFLSILPHLHVHMLLFTFSPRFCSFYWWFSSSTFRAVGVEGIFAPFLRMFLNKVLLKRFLTHVAKAEDLSSRKKGSFLTTHLFSFYSYSRGVTETESAHWCKLGHRVSPGCIFYKIELLGAISQTTLAVIFFKRYKVLTEVQTKRN